MKKIVLPILFIACILLTGCNNNEPETKDKTSTIMLYVDSHMEDMMLLGGWSECLRVKEEKESEWYKHTGIVGFDYEKGFQYQLKVEKTTLSNPPADGSSVVYRLLEVVSKKFDGYNISFKYHIEAEDADGIEAHLKSVKEEMSKCFYLLYNGYLKNTKLGIIELIGANGESKFRYGIEQRNADEINKKYTWLLPEGQIVWAGDWILHESIEDEGVNKFFVILEKVSGFSVRSEQPLYVRHWIYKDLTEYYQQLYPGANVRSVIVVQDNEYSNTLKQE